MIAFIWLCIIVALVRKYFLRETMSAVFALAVPTY